ncbi:MAG: hypothetical protein JSW66_17340 [Phycisphaerales bacterium]|nr:MAG: hypothetical protein JSW66_17340 [Phycisphaerales bacterium]
MDDDPGDYSVRRTKRDFGDLKIREKTTVAAVDRAYRLAYRLGCKGVTVYRRRSHDQEPMSLC